LEDYVSRRGIIKIYNELIDTHDIKNLDVSDIGKSADEGDKKAIMAFGEAGRILAESIKDIINNNNIQCLLLGGKYPDHFVIWRRQ